MRSLDPSSNQNHLKRFVHLLQDLLQPGIQDGHVLFFVVEGNNRMEYLAIYLLKTPRALDF